MKKFLMILLAAVLIFSLAGCGNYVSIFPDREVETEAGEQSVVDADGSFIETPLYTFIGWYDFAENYYSDTPAAVSLCVVTDGAEGCQSPRMDRTSIIAACDALRAMTVVGPAETPSDGQNLREYTFTMSSGDEYTVVFDAATGCLITSGGTYTVSGGEELWQLTFPIYSKDFDVFDLYYSDDIRAFADNFYTDMPVSVGLRSGSGATMTSDDQAVIEQVFSLLAGATITVMEEHPDQNIDLTQTRDFIFTMADGTYYTFSFAGQCLAVKASADYGTVYYWLSGHEGLWTLAISPDGTSATFEGGSLYELRDDITQVHQVLTGETEESAEETEDAGEALSIAGVYVSYTIGDTSGGIAISGDEAVQFVQTVLDIAVTAEPAAEIDGDSIEIFITLSDGSGPSISFYGGSVQQVVGTNYICDSAGYEAMCDAILSMGADGAHTAEVGMGLD